MVWYCTYLPMGPEGLSWNPFTQVASFLINLPVIRYMHLTIFFMGFQNRRDCPARLRTLKRVRCGLYDFFRFTRIPAAIIATLKKNNHEENLC
jgi:hypothetical protein